MTEESQAREEICRWGRSLFERGMTPGSSGNMSVRLGDGSILATPTNACLGFLRPDGLAKLAPDRTHVDGDSATKEMPLHWSIYDARPTAKAVVHLHSTYSTALSCLADVDPDDAIPPITPYVVMRVGHVPVAPYVQPGSSDIGALVATRAARHPAILLANHGPIVAGSSLRAAVFAIEELEETARLVLVLRGLPVRTLSANDIAELQRVFPNI